MRILLCDDEPMVRLGLKSKLMELYPGQLQFIDAANGRELVAKATQCPDIAFVDIKMPLMDGLTAIEQAQKKTPNTIWLLLTGYSEFSYAQTALRIGVADYLTKPIGTEELSAVMEDICRRLRKQAAVRNQAFSIEILDLFYDSDIRAEAVRMHHPKGYSVYVFYADHHATMLESLALPPGAGLRQAAFTLPTGEPCVVVEGGAWQEAKGAGEGTVIYAEGLPTGQRLLAAGNRISQIAALRIVCGLPGFVPLDQLEQMPQKEPLLRVAQLVDKLCLAYLDENSLLYNNTLAELRRIPRAELDLVDYGEVTRYLQTALRINIQAQGQSLPGLFEAIRAGMRDPETKAGKRGTVAQVVQHIENHFAEDISVNSIAESLGITPSYLSRIFHQQTGEKFIDYLSKVRITAAKQLLCDAPGLPIKQVAERVGYQNPKHFAKMFSKMVGMPPSDFQASIPV